MECEKIKNWRSWKSEPEILSVKIVADVVSSVKWHVTRNVKLQVLQRSEKKFWLEIMNGEKNKMISDSRLLAEIKKSSC